MASHLLAIQVEDVNGDPVPGAAVVVADISSSLRSVLTGKIEGGSALRMVFDLGTASLLSIELSVPDFFGYTMVLKQDVGAGTYEVNARSPAWGLFSSESGDLGVALTLVALRVRQAPMTVASAPARDVAPRVVDDPAGIWLDASRRVVELFDQQISAFPAILGREILGNAEADNWDRFKAITSAVDPHQADGGNSFHWLEYGDPAGFRMLVAVWVVNRAAARPDGKVDLHFFFCPHTDIDFYAPASVYPYKRKRVNKSIVQPYSILGYKYLSPGFAPSSDLGIGYQAIASKKSHILVMPLNAYGFPGPLPCRSGLNRLAKEVTAFLSDWTSHTLPIVSQYPAGSRQLVNRIAVSGYSAGAPDTIKLFRYATLTELTDSYRKAKGDPQAQDFAKRLSALKAPLWQSPVRELDRKWTEFYSVDGFYGSDQAKDFPAELASWFAADPEHVLRIYATNGRMSSPMEVASKLAEAFRGVTPTDSSRAADPKFTAKEWHRSDGRATLAWFSEAYMKFHAVPFMPSDEDAHHTIPRVVFSHALSQSKLLQV